MVKMYLDVVACSYKENIDFAKLLALPTYNSHKIGDIWHRKTPLDYSEWSYNSDIFETRNIDFILRSFMNSIKDKQDIFIKRLKETESELSIYVVVEKEETDSINGLINKDLLLFYASLNASISIDGLVNEIFDTNLTIEDTQYAEVSQENNVNMSLDFNITSNEPIRYLNKKSSELGIQNEKKENKYVCKISTPVIKCIDTDELLKYFYKQFKLDFIENTVISVTTTRNLIIYIDNGKGTPYSISFEPSTINFLRRLNTDLFIDFKLSSN